MQELIRRWRDMPPAMQAYLASVVVAILAAWAMTRGGHWMEVSVFTIGYGALVAWLAMARADWARFVISAVHLIMLATLAYGLVFILPVRAPGPLFAWRAALVAGGSALALVLLWHRDTGRWIAHRR